MKKQCSTCEFNFGGTCAGHGDVYQYGETISDNTKCCNDWVSVKANGDLR